MNILILDNYDSFTYNLAHLAAEVTGREPSVRRNDAISLDEVDEFEAIILSPGPGIPEEAGIMPELVKRYGASKRILGVCLGHQCIAQIFGGSLINLPAPFHGRALPTRIVDSEEYLFNGLPAVITTGRYHSWAVDRDRLPSELVITAEDDSGIIMGIRHRRHDVRGVQFHPESFLTEFGAAMLSNWLSPERSAA